MDFDQAELARLQAGDIRALESCYRSFGARVARLCRGMLGNRADAEDATQEVFVRAFERAAQFRGGSRFSTWLFRLTVNHCIHRRERRRVRSTEPLPIDREHANGNAFEARDALDWWLAQLPDDQRAVLVLREVEGLSYAEVADALEVPVGTVMSRIHRARERLTKLAKASDRPVADPRARTRTP